MLSYPPLKILKSNKRTLTLLHPQQCLTIFQVNEIHGHLIVSGTISDPFAAAKLISLLTTPPHTDLIRSHLIFRRLPFPPSTFLYNLLIKSHTQLNQSDSVFSLYRQMLAGYRSRPNNYTFSFLLRSSLHFPSSFAGQQLHSQIIKLGWESYDFVQNGLIHLYTTFNCIDSARQLFDRSPNKDVITWTAMVNGYAKSGLIDLARELFHRMPEKNAVSWSTIITAYAQIGMFQEALEAFNLMQLEGIRPNNAGIIGALSACGFLGAFDQGKWIHVFVKRNGIELDRVLGTALIDMYSKCGCIENAQQVFQEMKERDVFAYTSMISGLSNHGNAQEAVDLFNRMQEKGVRPNEITFICVISACGRMGFVDQGRELFGMMKWSYGIEPRVEHYGCLVDLLGRAGLVAEAKRVVREMPMEPDSYVLGALLNGCRMHGEVELAKETAKRLGELGIDHSGVHVLMSNVFAAECRWENVMQVRKKMDEKMIRKVPGCSLVEIDGVACEFVAGDRSHVQMEEIVLAVRGMDNQLQSFGHDAF